MLKSTKTLLFSAVLVFSIMTIGQPANADPDNLGTEFILGIMENIKPGSNILFLTGSVATSGLVDIPGLAFSTPFLINPGTITSVTLPPGVEHLGNDTTLNIGILVTSGEEIAVYGLNQKRSSTDAFLGLPTDILGTDHVILAANSNVVEGSEMAVVAIEDTTTVTITPSVSTGVRKAGVPYDIILDRLQSYQLKADDPGEDLSGSIVTSDKPVAVFGGHRCANVPPGTAYCDHVVEQIPPTATWGESFLTESLATRTKGDIFRIAVRDDATDVMLDGEMVTTINRNQFHEMNLDSGTGHEINTTGPALLMQYSKGTKSDNVTADPFQMMIPPTEQFLSDYTLSTPAATPVAFNNFINTVVATADIKACTLDEVVLNPADFKQIGESSFSAAQLPVSIGAHNLACPSPLGAYSYGFATADSYGYPGGLALAPIAEGIKAEIDIKFCSDPNGFNSRRSRGVVPVTIFGTNDLSVYDLDVNTLQLCNVDLSSCTNAPANSSFADRGDLATDIGAGLCFVNAEGVEQDYLNQDGMDDLDAAFRVSEVCAVIDCDSLNKGDSSPTMVLIGATNEGMSIKSMPINDNAIDQLFIQR